MKTVFKLFFISLLTTVYATAEVTNNDSHQQENQGVARLVLPIVNAFKDEDKKIIASSIQYPLKRETPIPPINNEQEMLMRFDEVFDEAIVQRIIESDPSNDWSKLGWRGIMFMHGDLWLNSEGTIISVNYQSAQEKSIKAQLIEQQKNVLHTSIAVFKSPVLEWETKKFRVRIDLMKDDSYRYAVWKVAASSSSKPDLILLNGEISFDGSGGNHSYVFLNGHYTYECAVTVLGTDLSPPGVLSVYKGDGLILQQPVLKVVR
jgi:hypothetical protein